MLDKIETQEIVTTRAAIDKYRTKFFVMVITEVVDQCDNDLGYVIYTADKRKELHSISRDEYKGKKVAFLFGDGTEPYPQIGNLVHHDQD